MICLCSITAEPSKLMDRARRAIDLGANGLLVAYSACLGALRELTSSPDITVPVMLHASHMIAMMKQIAWPVPAKLCRLCGADMMLTPTMWSSIPMACAGVYPGLAETIIGEYRPDIVIPAGGGMLGHPDGYTAGAQSWQQAIAAGSGAEALEQGATPRHREVRIHRTSTVPVATCSTRISTKTHGIRMKNLSSESSCGGRDI